MESSYFQWQGHSRIVLTKREKSTDLLPWWEVHHREGTFRFDFSLKSMSQFITSQSYMINMMLGYHHIPVVCGIRAGPFWECLGGVSGCRCNSFRIYSFVIKFEWWCLWWRVSNCTQNCRPVIFLRFFVPYFNQRLTLRDRWKLHTYNTHIYIRWLWWGGLVQIHPHSPPNWLENWQNTC